MVGELENFPSEAQQKIADGGGLESFLLESLRFVMMDELIGLMKHAVSLTDTLHPSHLNPSAKEFWPLADALSDTASHDSLPNEDDKEESASSDPFLLLPDPYVFECPVYEYPCAEHTPASAQREDKHTAVCVRVRWDGWREYRPDECGLWPLTLSYRIWQSIQMFPLTQSHTCPSRETTWVTWTLHVLDTDAFIFGTCWYQMWPWSTNPVNFMTLRVIHHLKAG